MLPEVSRPPCVRPAQAPLRAAWLAAAVLLSACASAPAPVAPMATGKSPTSVASAPAPAPQAPTAAPAAPPAPSPAPQPDPAGLALQGVLAHADRVRSLPIPELAQEIARLGESPATSVRQVQLALTLLQTQAVPDGLRAQALLQRVLGQDSAEARMLHPLARQVAGQYAAQRRAEEVAERQAQQIRDGQRRIDQLNDRLEALRAIERSLPSRSAQ